MAYRIPMTAEMTFPMQLKTLADEELLDYWAEVQKIDGVFNSENSQFVPSQDYERQIVWELQLRTGAQRVQVRK